MDGLIQLNPIYPRDKPRKVSGGTSLGAFGPTATGGTIPVVTLEAPSFGSLSPTGTRSTEAFLRPLRAFLTDPALLDTQAEEDILADIDAFTAAESLQFLTGRLPLASPIFERIQLRVTPAGDRPIPFQHSSVDPCRAARRSSLRRRRSRPPATEPHSRARQRRARQRRVPHEADDQLSAGGGVFRDDI